MKFFSRCFSLSSVLFCGFRSGRCVKNHPAVAGYYIGDELDLELNDKLRWHSDILSTIDLEKPTFYLDNKFKYNSVLSRNGSADILGEDNYRIGNNKDDSNINNVGDDRVSEADR